MRSIAVLVSIWMMTLPAANAACSGNACDNEYIDMLYVQGSYVLIELSGDKSALSCNLYEGRFIRRNQSHGKSAVERGLCKGSGKGSGTSIRDGRGRGRRGMGG